ncbi:MULTISPECIES: DUF5818 domain-containing protein [unclassified Corallococcus]|uniref:DUF5818 domain-containing protein n=1 Tax=unclassified Corallococcus TaxID=2685029 RepID=UPI001A8C5CF9|nr:MULTISPECIES: DUF5818 domain-containing protein [unclassified Corallococcus]MBN9686285.1 hypothetical protein [Corallococcus sp. NCSPR001]WAS82284.1 DUF5818 domain-containing protein [Corallococcus sp. NCRR]
MKLSGTVQYQDLEGGVWVLKADDGRTYQLAGGDRKIKKDGQRISAEGSIQSDAVTTAMVGPVFHVSSYKAE